MGCAADLSPFILFRPGTFDEYDLGRSGEMEGGRGREGAVDGAREELMALLVFCCFLIMQAGSFLGE